MTVIRSIVKYLLIFVSFLLASEMLIQTIVAIGDRPNTFESHPSLGYALRSNSTFYYSGPLIEYKDAIIKTNNDGIRGSSLNYRRTSSIYRLILLGNEQVLGFNVPYEYTIGFNLERHLNRNIFLGRKSAKRIWFQVFNLGMIAFNTAQQIRLLKYHEAFLQPNAVLLLYSLCDMTLPFYVDAQGYFRDDLSSSSKTISLKNMVITTLIKKSHLFSLLKRGSRRSIDQKCLNLKHETNENLFTYNINALKEFVSYMQSNGVKLAIIVVPHQYDSYVFTDNSTKLERIISLLKEKNVPLLDMTRGLYQGYIQATNYDENGYLNIKGNKYAYERILDFLTENIIKQEEFIWMQREVKEGEEEIILKRYVNHRRGIPRITDYQPGPDYQLEMSLGKLYKRGSITRYTLYECSMIDDYEITFISVDKRCEGQVMLNELGSISKSQSREELPLYRCKMTKEGPYFASLEKNCENRITDNRGNPLGYIKSLD